MTSKMGILNCPRHGPVGITTNDEFPGKCPFCTGEIINYERTPTISDVVLGKRTKTWVEEYKWMVDWKERAIDCIYCINKSKWALSPTCFTCMDANYAQNFAPRSDPSSVFKPGGVL